MAIDLVMGDSIFSTGVSIDVPVSDGLVSFGLGGDMLGINLVEGGVQPTIVGNPIRIDAKSSKLGNFGYLDLNIHETENFTYISVNKIWTPTGLSACNLIGTFQTTSDTGVTVAGSGLIMEANGYRTSVASVYDGTPSGATVISDNISVTNGTSPPPATEDTATWRFLAAIYDGNGDFGSGETANKRRYIIDKTVGATLNRRNADLTMVRDLRGKDTIRVGNMGSRLIQNSTTIMGAYAVYNRALPAAEFDLMYKRMQEIAAANGWNAI
ncbi:hypothetical protein GW643_10350 [Serratia marcescens]|uniref:hypothetical protein n=1 Tax=Serratia marcescens TaxID=615 RepID=UPI00137767EE|nr:hypothetical protein [Serratia marcescens]NCJ10791.1 hypothetical protein [Serratia marcescens]NDJ01012.1 hypothetical protein [Serratia marcescens]